MPDSTPAETAAIWQSFHDRLTHFIAARVGPEDADDITQEVFLRIHRSLQDGVLPKNVSGWIHQIARNAVIDHYRRRGADPTTPHPDPDDARTAALDGLDHDEDARVALEQCVRPMLDTLPARYRTALTLTALDGLSQADAARQAGVSLSGMKSRVQRGRRLLASSFQACCELQFDARNAPIDCTERC